jgi:hypothetical protein
LAGLCLVLAAVTGARAALDPNAPARPSPVLEIVVLETPGCLYCGLFRRDVFPQYIVSPRSAEVPMRFLDLNSEASAALQLNGPIGIIPTVVVVHHGREVGRLEGYVGPEIFFHSLDRLFAGLP